MSGARKVLSAVRAAGGRLEMVGDRDMRTHADEIAHLLLDGFRSCGHLVAALTGSGRWLSLEGRTLRVHGHANVGPLPDWLEAAVERSKFELVAFMRKPAPERTSLEREGIGIAEAYGVAWLQAQGGRFRG